MTREERAWILYDVANSAFALVIMTTVMPLFFKDVAARGLPPAISTANWGIANAGASLVIAVCAPVLGAMADYPGQKKRFLTAFMLIGVIATGLLAVPPSGSWLLCLVIYACARIGFSGANLFYDAFLPDVAEPARMDRVSTAGYAWGYIGGSVPFLISIALILVTRTPAGGISPLAARISFVVVAAWWLAGSIPLLSKVNQRYFIAPSPTPVRDAFRRLGNTLSAVRKHRPVFLFLIAYFCYIDGVHTIITMAAAYGRDAGLSVGTLVSAILFIQIVAFPFALLYGHLAARFSTKRMLLVGIGVYTGITFLGFFLPDLPGAWKGITFWILAFLVATSQGGIQGLSRSYFGRLIPKARSAEFYGFYNVFGKFAAILGPFLMAVVSRAAGHSRYGIISVLLLFAAGGAVLYRIDPEGGDETG